MNIAPNTIWNSLPAPALLLNEDNTIAGANSAAEHFLNLSAEKLCGVPVFDRLSVETSITAALDRVRSDKSPVFVKNVDVVRGRVASVVCNMQIAPVVDDPSHILLLIEPQRLDKKFNRIDQEKSSARSAIGMAEMLAHEIKNPLAGITGAAQLLAMNLDSEGREMTDLIVAESRRIVTLLDQVDHFGDQRPPSFGAENIHDILDQARRSASLGFAEKMTIEIDYDPSIPSTYVDADQMIQVFLNLIKNASEAAGESGGNLKIRTFYETGLRLRGRDSSNKPLAIQVEISDDGPGVPPQIEADIFEPFVSGRANGTGLGLALVSKTIAQHGGWISVDSTPGRTVFRVSLPVASKMQKGPK